MDFNEFKYKANYYVLILIAFVIPLDRKLAPPLIILLLLTSILNNRIKKIKTHKVLFFSVLYLLYAIGVSYSSNLEVGVKSLVENLSYIIFPISIYLSDINFRDKINNILQSFVDGCLASILISMIISLINFYFTLETSSFFYGNSSYFFHSSYMAMYASFGLLIVYSVLFNKKEKSKLNQLKLGGILFVLTASIILSASKTGLISMLLINGIAFFYWIIKSEKYIKGGLFFVLVLTSLFVSYNSSSILKNRVNELIAVASTEDSSTHSSTTARVEIWKVSIGLIKEKPLFGYGTGDVKEVLIEAYNNKGLVNFAEKKLNTHNQFFQTSIAIGIVGAACLFLMLLIPFILSYKNRKNQYLYSFFILLIFVNLLTESMLERQAGIVFYCFFNSLFFVAYFGDSDKKNRLLD